MDYSVARNTNFKGTQNDQRRIKDTSERRSVETRNKGCQEGQTRKVAIAGSGDLLRQFRNNVLNICLGDILLAERDHNVGLTGLEASLAGGQSLISTDTQFG